MTPRPIPTALAVALLVGLATPGIAQNIERTAAQTAAAVEGVDLDQRLDAQVPLDLTFRNTDGELVRLRDLMRPGRPAILTLVFYECPMMCGEILNGLSLTLNELAFSAGEEFDVITVSFNAAETHLLARQNRQAYLAGYTRPAAEAGWHFLVGEQENIDALCDAVGFRYVYDERQDTFAHAAGIMILTPEGRVSKYFYGLVYPPAFVRLALVEASEGKIGTAVDRIMLFCYDWDPETGSYAFMAWRVTQVVTFIFTLGVGVFMYLLFKFDPARRRRVAPGAPA